MSANSAGIAERLGDCLRRQLAMLEAIPPQRADFQSRLDDPDASALAAAESRVESQLTELVKEFVLLKREWDETDELPESECFQVEALMEQVRRAIAAAQPTLRESARMTRERMDTVKASMDTLRRGKQIARAYGKPRSGQGGGLDTQG